YTRISFDCMATKKQVLEKIADLLKDINNQYEELENDTAAEGNLKGDLFEATVNYFAAYAAVYNKLQKAEMGMLNEPQVEVDDNHPDQVTSNADEQEEIVFTPAIDTAEEQASHAEQVEDARTDDMDDQVEEEEDDSVEELSDYVEA